MLVAGCMFMCVVTLLFFPHTAVGTTPRAEHMKGVVSECRVTLWKGKPKYKKKTCASKAWVGLTVGTTPQISDHILNTGPPLLALGNSNHVYTFEVL